MNSQIIIKHEYFELVKKLNRANKFKNQETAVYFYIDSTLPNHLKLFAAISFSQKILICEKTDGSRWLPSGFSGYSDLETYITQILRTIVYVDDLTNYITSHIFKLPS